jgi:hypothetical protein
MSMTGTISSIKLAMEALGKIREASRTLVNAELKQAIADLSDQLATTSQEVADLKLEVRRVTDENIALKSAKEDGKPDLRDGRYYFDGDETPYCPKCFETRGKKYAVTKMDIFWQCTVCDKVVDMF